MLITCAGSDSFPATRSSSSTMAQLTTQRPSSRAIRSATPRRSICSMNPRREVARDCAGSCRGERGHLAFTDDDVNVEEGWLDAVRDAMADFRSSADGATMAARAAMDSPRARFLGIHALRGRRSRCSTTATDRPAALGPRAALGANLAGRSKIMKVGGFPAHLGKLRGTLLSGEDHELCHRVPAAGFRAMYSPKASVQHWVPADRARAGTFCAGSTGPESRTPSWGPPDVSGSTGRAIHGLPLWNLAARAVAALACNRPRRATSTSPLRLRGRTTGGDEPARRRLPSLGEAV